MSHPVWVRGLKLGELVKIKGAMESHPVWVRGLKLVFQRLLPPFDFVAPRVGAWIETVITGNKNIAIEVAPRVGAWIETSTGDYAKALKKSHPVWVRGLKHDFYLEDCRLYRRTPCGCVD